MSKLVVFSLLGGDLDRGFPVVTAQLWYNNQSVKITGSLPAIPELSELYRSWQLLYEAIHERLGSNQRIKVHSQDITHISVNDFEGLCQQLQVCINTWLKSESFQNIERQLRTLLSRDDEIRVIIETHITLLHRLPWHLWDFFEDYPNAEVALSNHEYASPQILQKSPTGKVKILAILGNSVGINIDKDRSLLQKLKDTQTTFLVEPTRRELDEQLWDRDWDILFFAGHSVSLAGGEKGEIQINQTESLTISQFKYALQTAITRGLKLAIFNSCDGIGLARNLADLNIPQIIVMREPVSDLVAQQFLNNFLMSFTGGKPFFLAVREARKRLQALENEFPCASWLPVICQNPTTVPITWQALRDRPWRKPYPAYREAAALQHRSSNTEAGNHVSIPSRISVSKTKLWTVLLSTIIVTLVTISLRYLGVFQKAELQIFDQMLLLRPKEELDHRLVIVEITEKDIQSRQGITTGLKSISDSTLAELINKLQQHQPRVVGLDIYRDFTDPPDKLKPIQLADELNQENVVVVCKGKDSKHDPQGVKPPQKVPVERQGFTDAILDPDGVIRRQILMMDQDFSSPCKTPHSLSLQLAARYLSDKNLELDEDYVKFNSKTGSKIFKRLKPGLSGGYQNLETLGGIQILVNYRDADYRGVTLEYALSDGANLDFIKDKVVLIGVTANTVGDTWRTPYSEAKQEYQETPGVYIQAQMVSQILSAVLDERPIFWVLPDWGDILWIWGWSSVSGLIVWNVRSRSARLSLGASLLNGGCAIVATVIVLYGVCAIALCATPSKGIALFPQGAWLPFLPTAFAVVTSSVVVLSVHSR
ncbi:CHASE2 domain-containing protein [Scytonema sp. UIC 10036]|uniref:CHASE2 domain-containing protein n=1 Tax=Scytonema sp. UIC 10036 TaxID=2304196 RepID=UPI0012DA3DDC|nr:CHASE2 domain-containing protein [Scytonema sp. UIC 10036]MUG91174.1 CHASE2 domain-containing protein [Scytonema sp. UIC 10036]